MTSNVEAILHQIILTNQPILEKLQLQGKSLDFIEKDLPEELILATEDLYESNSVHGETIGKSNWSLTVQDNSFHYQVEVQIKSNKVDNYTCNCTTYLKDGICPHVAASLLYVRQKKDIPQEPVKKNSLKRSQFQNKLNEVIKSMSETELVSLISDLARKDPVIKLTLYARRYPQLSKSERKLLIERTFPTFSRVDQKVSAKMLNQFITLAEELKVQLANFIMQEDYLEAYHLLLALLQKSYYVKSKLKTLNKKYLENHQSLVEAYIELLDQIEAPDLRDTSTTNTIDLLGSSYISVNQGYEEQMWMQLYERPEYHELLREIITKKLKSNIESDPETPTFLKYVQLLLLDADAKKKEIKLFDQQMCYQLIQIALRHSSSEGSASLLKDFLINAPLNNFVAKQIIKKVHLNTTDEKLEKKMVDLFLTHKDKSYLEFLEKHIRDTDELNSKIEGMLAEYDDPEYLLQYYVASGQAAKAIDTMNQSRDIDLLMKFDRALIKNYKKELTRLYKDVCTDYVESHFGNPAREFLLSVYQHLTAIGGETIVRKLQDHIKEVYRNRRSLKKELI